MTLKHNQQLNKNHFRKDWQRRVRVHFNQPGRKSARRSARVEKAVKVAPRPVDKLRPVVRCPTIKYNRRVRAGRGFSLAELKAAGIPKKYAPTIGISVDPRRQNLSEEGLKVNVERLQEYMKRVIVFPRKGKTVKGDASKEEVEAARTGENIIKQNRVALAIKNVAEVPEVKISDEKSEEGAFKKLRAVRSEARLVGVREKRAKAKAEEAADKKK
ncbi:60S ribosomal protein L13 [Venturia nashicola]|uniref:60S ribosomal protein L13 n=1 Tax=Venturia nashicola TaxID=86259 RepID=A0A4Z1PQ01_9PEZI|nr:60S ribosomal protein L13 [Venturia nashicola]TLD37264.1 60S ribosomal protein L13 [Venturia nashicola]